MGSPRSGEKENHNSAKPFQDEPSAVADLDASIAENAIRIAHLYCERAKMSEVAKDHASAVRDKSRAESLYHWATQAAESTNTAGRDVLRPELERLKAELEAFHIAKGASAP